MKNLTKIFQGHLLVKSKLEDSLKNILRFHSPQVLSLAQELQIWRIAKDLNDYNRFISMLTHLEILTFVNLIHNSQNFSFLLIEIQKVF